MQKKYAADYRMEPEVLPNGRVTEKRVYVGPYYRFCAPAEAFSHSKKLYPYAVLSVTCFFVLVFSMPRFPIDSWFYTVAVLGGIFAVFPLYGAWACLWRIYTAKERLTREHRDRIANRLSVMPIFLLVFYGIMTAGFLGCLVVTLVQKLPITASMVVCELCGPLGIGAAAWLLSLRKGLATEEITSDPDSGEDPIVS